VRQVLPDLSPRHPSPTRLVLGFVRGSSSAPTEQKVASSQGNKEAGTAIFLDDRPLPLSRFSDWLAIRWDSRSR